MAVSAVTTANRLQNRKQYEKIDHRLRISGPLHDLSRRLGQRPFSQQRNIRRPILPHSSQRHSLRQSQLPRLPFPAARLYFPANLWRGFRYHDAQGSISRPQLRERASNHAEPQPNLQTSHLLIPGFNAPAVSCAWPGAAFRERKSYEHNVCSPLRDRPRQTEI